MDMSQFVGSLAVELLGIAIAGVVVMIWGKWSGTTLWHSTIGALLVMIALFLFIKELGWWEPPPKVKIHQWLDGLSISVKDLPTSDSSDFDFRFECISESNTQPIPEYRFYIQRPKNFGNGFIVMESAYSMLKSFKNWKTLESGKKAALVRKFKIDLSMKGINYTFTDEDDRVILRYLIPVSSLTFDQLVKGYTTLTDSTFIISNTVGLALE